MSHGRFALNNEFAPPTPANAPTSAGFIACPAILRAGLTWEQIGVAAVDVSPRLGRGSGDIPRCPGIQSVCREGAEGVA